MIERLHDSLENDTSAWQLQRVTRVTGVDGVREMGSSMRENWTDELAELIGNWFDDAVADRRRAADLMVTMARGIVFDFLDTPPALRARPRRDGDGRHDVHRRWPRRRARAAPQNLLLTTPVR